MFVDIDSIFNLTMPQPGTSLQNQGKFLYMNNFCSAFRISGRVYNRMYFVFKGKWTYNCGGRGGVLISGGAHKRQFTVGIALSSPFIDYLKF